MKPGDRVHIIAAHHSSVATVLGVDTIDTLPEIPDFHTADQRAAFEWMRNPHPHADTLSQVKQIMREFGWMRFVRLGYVLQGQPLCFTAIETPDGWTDLRGQQLSIVPLMDRATGAIQ